MNLNRRELICFGAVTLGLSGAARAAAPRAPLAIIVDRSRFVVQHRSRQCLILESGHYVNEAFLQRVPSGTYETDLEPANQFLLEQLSRSQTAISFKPPETESKAFLRRTIFPSHPGARAPCLTPETQ